MPKPIVITDKNIQGKNITWINFLHFYLNPSQEPEIISLVANESYRLIAAFLKSHPNYRVTINFTGCLTEMLAQRGFLDIIKEYRELMERGQIELVETAAYHPILPLLPAAEIINQIKINREINQKYFGKKYQPRGFFLPECAYSLEVAKIIENLGYQWILLDEISFNGKLNQVDFSKQYKIKGTQLRVVFRNRALSKGFAPHDILKFIENIPNNNFIVTATDAELYGHRHKDLDGELPKLIKNPAVKTVTVSEFLSQNRPVEIINPVASNWESLEEELKNNIPYALWKHPKNTIQKHLWELAELAISHVSANENDENYQWARGHLNHGLSSCGFWWASGRDFLLFGHPAWKPDEIEKGATELIRSIRSLESLDGEMKIKAEKIYFKIINLTWTKHWKKFYLLC